MKIKILESKYQNYHFEQIKSLVWALEFSQNHRVRSDISVRANQIALTGFLESYFAFKRDESNINKWLTRASLNLFVFNKPLLLDCYSVVFQENSEPYYGISLNGVTYCRNTVPFIWGNLFIPCLYIEFIDGTLLRLTFNNLGNSNIFGLVFNFEEIDGFRPILNIHSDIYRDYELYITKGDMIFLKALKNYIYKNFS